jgi:hypothetical protein
MSRASYPRSMNEPDHAFFEDLADKIDRMTADAATAVERPEDTGWEDEDVLRVLHAALATPEERHAFESFVNELLVALTHSILVTIDGGTAYSDAHGTPQLVHGDGQPFGEGLHELFIGHLLDTGRHR